LKCVYLPHDKVHHNTFIGSIADRGDRVKTHQQYMREQQDRRDAIYKKIRSSDEEADREKRLKRSERKRLNQLKGMGIDYEFSGYNRKTDDHAVSPSNADGNSKELSNDDATGSNEQVGVENIKTSKSSKTIKSTGDNKAVKAQKTTPTRNKSKPAKALAEHVTVSPVAATAKSKQQHKHHQSSRTLKSPLRKSLKVAASA